MMNSELGTQKSKLKKAFKALAEIYFWICIALGVSPFILGFLYVAFTENELYLTKVSLDGKFLAKLDGGTYQVRLAGSKPDLNIPDGIYIEQKSTHHRWLVAQQSSPTKELTARDIDVVWQPDDSLNIITFQNVSLKNENLVIDGQKIKVTMNSPAALSRTDKKVD